MDKIIYKGRNPTLTILDSSTEAPVERPPRIGREAGAGLGRNLSHLIYFDARVADIGYRAHMFHSVLG